MLDINIIREQPELVRKALADRQIETTPVDQILELDLKRRQTIQESERLKAERNAVSKEIGKAKAPFPSTEFALPAVAACSLRTGDYAPACATLWQILRAGLALPVSTAA